MTIQSGSLAVAVATILVSVSLSAYPHVFADHVTARLTLAGHSLFARSLSDLPQRLTPLAHELASRPITVELRQVQHTTTLADIGVQLDLPATLAAIRSTDARWPWQRQAVTPQFTVNQAVLLTYIEEAFQNSLRPPQSASLTLTRRGEIRLVPSKTGEVVDGLLLLTAVREALTHGSQTPIALQVASGPPRVEDTEVDLARSLTEQLLAHGLTLTFAEQPFALSGPTLRNLIEFVEQIDPQDPTNYILGVRLNPKRLRRYLETDIAAKLNQPTVNARFTLSEIEGSQTPRVDEFSAPQRGLTVNIDATAQQIARAVTLRQGEVSLVVDSEEPLISQHADIQALGITSLLARGESDFASSPRNRIHNITVGASRYQGLLILPGEEFSFNEHLGPVNAAAGFKPELVIKNNATIPEFGGGLCQVSTTAFRAAIHTGLEVTERRNHAYAVRYYGTPGFDATIYPGYTDLRFRNNTPGHILIQTKIEGTKLIFEFWGTPDGRTVEIDGPTPYNRQPNGAVKATLTQRVIKDGQTINQKVFASNYKSPALYPKVVAANGAPPPQTIPNASPP